MACFFYGRLIRHRKPIPLLKIGPLLISSGSPVKPKSSSGFNHQFVVHRQHTTEFFGNCASAFASGFIRCRAIQGDRAIFGIHIDFKNAEIGVFGQLG